MSFPFAELRDIHPGPLPPSHLWLALLLAGLGCGLAAWLCVRLFRRFAPLWRAYAALRALKPANPGLVPAISHWLKETSLHCYSREQIAKLHGAAWLDWLDQQAGGHFLQFASDWDSLTYGGVSLSDEAAEALLRECRHWLHYQFRRRLW